MRTIIIFFAVILCCAIAPNKDGYSDWKNRGLNGRVKIIEQEFFEKLNFVDGNWEIDTSKIFMTHKIVFDGNGQIGLITKRIRGKNGWKLMDYIYTLDSVSGRPIGYTCYNEKEKDAEKAEIRYRTRYLIESKVELPNFEFTVETIQLNEDFRSDRTTRRHLNRDKLVSEENIKDEYNEDNEIMRTDYRNTYYINPKKYTTKSTYNTYRIVSRDSQKNWLEMAVMLEETESLHYYTRRTIEYFK